MLRAGNVPSSPHNFVVSETKAHLGPNLGLGTWEHVTQPLKVKNCPNFLAFKWCAAHHCKALNQGYNFALNFISIRGLYTKLWAPKVAKVLTLGISRLPLWSPSTKWHLGAGLVARHKIYYKGEGGGFPQVWVVVSLVSLCLPVVSPCTKMLQLCIDQVVVRFVQVSVNNWIAY